MTGESQRKKKVKPDTVKANVHDFVAAMQGLQTVNRVPDVPVDQVEAAITDLADALGIEGNFRDAFESGLRKHHNLPLSIAKGCFPLGFKSDKSTGGCYKYHKCPKDSDYCWDRDGLVRGFSDEAAEQNTVVCIPKEFFDNGCNQNPYGALPLGGCSDRTDEKGAQQRHQCQHGDKCRDHRPCTYFGCVTPEMVGDAKRKLRKLGEKAREELASGKSELSADLLHDIVRTVDGCCPYHRRHVYVDDTQRPGEKQMVPRENPFRFLQCFVAMTDEGRSGVLMRPGFPLHATALAAKKDDLEGKGCEIGASMTSQAAGAGLSGIAIIAREDRHGRTYHAQSAAGDPDMRFYYEVPGCFFGDSDVKPKSDNNSDPHWDPVKKGLPVLLRALFREHRAGDQQRGEPELHSFFNDPDRSARSETEQDHNVLYCPDGEMGYSILNWRLMQFFRAWLLEEDNGKLLRKDLSDKIVGFRGQIEELLRSRTNEEMRKGAKGLSAGAAAMLSTAAREQIVGTRGRIGPWCEGNLEDDDFWNAGIPQREIDDMGKVVSGENKLLWSLADELSAQGLWGDDDARFRSLVAWTTAVFAPKSDARHPLVPVLWDALSREMAADLPDLTGQTPGALGLMLHATDLWCTMARNGVALDLISNSLRWKLQQQGRLKENSIVMKPETAEDLIDIMEDLVRFPLLPYYVWRSAEPSFLLGHLAFPVGTGQLSFEASGEGHGANTHEVAYVAAGFHEDCLFSAWAAKSTGANPLPDGTALGYYLRHVVSESGTEFHLLPDIPLRLQYAKTIGQALATPLASANFYEGLDLDERLERERQVFHIVHDTKNLAQPLSHVNLLMKGYMGLANRISEGLEAMVIGSRVGKKNREDGLLGKLKQNGIISNDQWEAAVAHYQRLFDEMPEIAQSGKAIGKPNYSYLEKVSRSANMLAPLLNCHVTLARKQLQYTKYQVGADGDLAVVPITVSEQIERWLLPCISSRMLSFPDKSLYFNTWPLSRGTQGGSACANDASEWFSDLNVEMVLPEVAIFAIVIPELITNAFKHSPAGSNISVVMRAGAGEDNPAHQQLSFRIENRVKPRNLGISAPVQGGGVRVPGVLATHLGLGKESLASVFRNEYDVTEKKWISEFTFSCQSYHETVLRQIHLEVEAAHETGLKEGALGI